MLFNGKLKVASLNIRGLGDKTKRRAIFDYLRKKDLDVVLIQEAHVDTLERVKLWTSEWGGKMVASCGPSNACGVITLLSSQCQYTILYTYSDEHGRLVIIVLEVNGKKYVIGNVYGPNCDDPTFFQEVVRLLENFSDSDCVILGGDFNFVMDPPMDRNNSLHNHVSSREVVGEYMDRANLCDIWRILNPQTERFMWYRWGRLHRLICSHIDTLLVPMAHIDMMDSCKIQTGYLTDHSLVVLTCCIDDYIRGPGSWKFNNQLLTDETFCNTINSLVPYIASKCQSQNPHEKWETIKMECGYVSKKYAKSKVHLKCKKENLLICSKQQLKTQILQQPDNLTIKHDLKRVSAELDDFAMQRANASIFRSKCNYAKDGEKCSKYFLTLEKHRYLEKNMKAVVCDDGSVSTCQKSILQEQTRFYKYLYESDKNVDFTFTPGEDDRTITEMERSMCDAPFTQDEFYDAVMTWKLGKVPGLDGITREFFRKFWKILAPHLIEMYQYSYDVGILPESVRKGLISLLPKRGKDTRYVKSMRPLTILPNDYKILAKALDNRIRMILPDLLCSEQTGFVRGRKICHNICKSLDIIDYTRLKGIPGLILSIDMEKCFDCLEHKSIFGSLQFFGLGNDFIRWVSLFYNQFLICTQNFGFFQTSGLKAGGRIRGVLFHPVSTSSQQRYLRTKYT